MRRWQCAPWALAAPTVMPCVPACAGCRSSHLHSIAFEHFLLIVAALSRCSRLHVSHQKTVCPTHCAGFHLAKGAHKTTIAAMQVYRSSVCSGRRGPCGRTAQRCCPAAQRKSIVASEFCKVRSCDEGRTCSSRQRDPQGNPTSWCSAAQKFHHSRPSTCQTMDEPLKRAEVTG